MLGSDALLAIELDFGNKVERPCEERKESQPHGTFLMDFRNNAWRQEQQSKYGLQTPICTFLMVVSSET